MRAHGASPCNSWPADAQTRAGDESKVMLEAHTSAGFTVGEPFGHKGLYDFGGHTSLTKRVTQLGGVMMQHRCGWWCIAHRMVLCCAVLCVHGCVSCLRWHGPGLACAGEAAAALCCTHCRQGHTCCQLTQTGAPPFSRRCAGPAQVHPAGRPAWVAAGCSSLRSMAPAGGAG